jgi:predicted secreted protein
VNASKCAPAESKGTPAAASKSPAASAKVTAHGVFPVAAATDPGAPFAPRLVGKAIWTPLISGVVFAALVAFADYVGIY